jgi:hypothetical protein
MFLVFVFTLLLAFAVKLILEKPKPEPVLVPEQPKVEQPKSPEITVTCYLYSIFTSKSSPIKSKSEPSKSSKEEEVTSQEIIVTSPPEKTGTQEFKKNFKRKSFELEMIAHSGNIMLLVKGFDYRSRVVFY